MMARNTINNGNNGFSRDRRTRPKPISVSAGAGQVGPAPQSARSQLLAGLRTAPRQNSAQAPYSATVGSAGAAEYYAALAAAQNPQYMQQMQMHGMIPDYESPEMDPEYVAQLQATEAFLLHRQQLLQNQIMQLTAQQFGGMSLAGQHEQMASVQHQHQQLLHHHQQQQHLQQQHQQQQQQQQQQLFAAAAAASGQTSLYAQQLQNGVSPIPQEIPGQPGLYLVYNPLTGQNTYAYDPIVQQQMGTMLPPNALPIGAGVQSPGGSGSGDADSGSAGSAGSTGRGSSPTKTGAGSPSQSAPKSSRHSSRPSQSNTRENSPPSRLQKLSAANAAKSSGSKPAGADGKGKFMTPFRQPYNPPSIAEIRAAPDTSIDGCKNFASMRRGEALKRLVSAGISRRSAQQTVSTPTVTVADYGFDHSPDKPTTGHRNLGSCGTMGAFTAATPMVLVPGSEAP